jgi:regulator of protease activity HflC (stomatin/prohibitin superfamily)
VSSYLIVWITGILCLVLGTCLARAFGRVVAVRQVMVVCGRITGGARRIVVGPRIAIVGPLESTRFLDLTMQSVQLNADDVVTSDELAVAASLDIFYAIDPSLLQVEDLDGVLPFLTKAERIVQAWTEYSLRSLASRFTTKELLAAPAVRSRIEGILKHTLQDRLGPFGMRIHTVRLLCRSTPRILEAQLVAKQTRLISEARAEAMRQLASMLGSNHNVSQLLPFELLQRVHEGESGLLTALNLPLPTTSSDGDQSTLAMHWLVAG